MIRSLGDIEGFVPFYEAYVGEVSAFLMRRMSDPETALDLLSETFMAALERRGQFRGATASEERAWLLMIARTAVSHHWRGERVRRAALQRLASDMSRVTTSTLGYGEQPRTLAAVDGLLGNAVAALPEGQRRALELRVGEDRPYLEVAAILGIEQATARARVSRGLRALGVALGQCRSAAGEGESCDDRVK